MQRAAMTSLRTQLINQINKVEQELYLQRSLIALHKAELSSHAHYFFGAMILTIPLLLIIRTSNRLKGISNSLLNVIKIALFPMFKKKLSKLLVPSP